MGDGAAHPVNSAASAQAESAHLTSGEKHLPAKIRVSSPKVDMAESGGKARVWKLVLELKRQCTWANGTQGKTVSSLGPAWLLDTSAGLVNLDAPGPQGDSSWQTFEI